MKNLKRGLFTVVIAFVAVTMFSGCELGAFLNLAKTLTDYNYVYVKNDTGADITLVIDEDDSTITADDDGEKRTAYDKTITVKSGATFEQAFIGGYYTLKIGDSSVLPDSSLSSSYTKATSNGYYLIYAHSTLTISKADDAYTYTLEGRSSN